MIKTVCGLDQCVGCSACLNICPVDAITLVDSKKSLNCCIDSNKCINCQQCFSHCQVLNNDIILRKPVCWYQGWSLDETSRELSSSGGFAYAASNYFIENRGVVCTCCFKDGLFRYSIFDDVESLSEIRGSKYVKSSPGLIYQSIIKLLRTGVSVLFIGLPCHVSALKLLCSKEDLKSLYTIDLICHGTPSQLMLEEYLLQYGISLQHIKQIVFRIKPDSPLISSSTVHSGVIDKYTKAFLNGLIYTENCYNCHFATTERCSDITIGDSWGTNLAASELSKGISLILCQTEKGKELLKNINFRLFEVDLDNAINNNQQLYRPSKKPENREKFFKQIELGKTYNQSLLLCDTISSVKLDIKNILLKIKVLKRDPEQFHIYYKL